ncbi:MAG: hypothetical protein AAF990_28495 [Bacteroidota bacterium]
MKRQTILIFAASLFFLFTTNMAKATNHYVADSTGFDGDHFSLEGAIALFKKAESPEAFEKLLNQEGNYVNNLDLNKDGRTDYIRVIDHQQGDVHAIVLQTFLDEDDSQDIAVIEIEKQGAENAVLQIVGDEDVFGEQIIAEPYEISEEMPGKGPSSQLNVHRIVINVWAWPSVRYIYRPSYRVYVSPWRWAAYPRWWSPWRPLAWRVYHPNRLVYRSNVRVVSTHRVVRAHRVYTPVRRGSTVVRSRTVYRRNTINASRTRGVTSRKTTVTRVNGPNGTVTRRKTTTRAAGKKGNKRVVGKKTSKRTRVRRH